MQSTHPRNIKRPASVRTTRGAPLSQSATLAPMNEQWDGRTNGKTSALPNNLADNLGSTPEGSAWAKRALHPCDQTAGGGIPLPDTAGTLSVNIESRHAVILSNPFTTDGNWDVELIVLPFPDIVAAYRCKLSSSSSWNYWQVLAGQTNGADPGRVQIEGISANPPFVIETVPQLSVEDSAVRQTFRGITVVANMSSLANQGIVTSGQWGAKPDTMSLKPSKDPVTTIPSIPHQVFKGIPVTPDDIVKECPNAGQWEAKKGVYMPMRFVDPTSLYLPTLADGLQNGNIVQYSGQPVVLVDTGSNPDAITSYAGDLLYVNQTSNSAYTSVGPINQNLGFIIFSGLASTAQLAIKIRTGLEIVPNPNTALASVAIKQTIVDKQAIDSVSIIGAQLPVSFPHKYNSLGMLMPLISAIAPTVMNMIGGFFRRRAAPRPRREVEIELD